MNKVYTIGRDPSCDIVIVDNTDVVSRVHSSLKVKGHGKYILVDQSRNGTYVNGIKMSSNEEIPVTRKDMISFAHVADLDWNQIPKEKTAGLRWVIISVVGLIVITLALYFIFAPKNEPIPEPIPDEISVETTQETSVRNDTVRDTVFIKEKSKSDTNRKAVPKKEKEPAPQTPEKEEEVVDALI